MKTCNGCGKAKPLEEFHKRACTKDGLNHRCKVCVLAHRQEYNSATIDARRATGRRRYANHSPETRARRYRQSHASRYGLTLEQYDAMLAQADGAPCPICNTTMSITSKGPDRACVDHCHASGQVRAMICNTCNVGLGMFRDQPELLRRAAEYLERQATRV